MKATSGRIRLANGAAAIFLGGLGVVGPMIGVLTLSWSLDYTRFGGAIAAVLVLIVIAAFGGAALVGGIWLVHSARTTQAPFNL